MTIDTDVTLRALQLGARDTHTGWYTKTYNETTEEMLIAPKGTSVIVEGIGFYPRYALSGFTQASVVEGDEIVDAFTKYYDVHEVMPLTLGNSLLCYECSLIRNEMHADRPATYGTSATVEDPRYRTGVYLNTYVTSANLLKDDGVSLASWTWCWNGADYPLTRIFIGKGIDLLFCINRITTKPVRGYDKSITHYLETLPITIYTINKTGITGENLCWRGEQELRRIFENNPFGSYREINTLKPESTILGSLTLYKLNVEYNYERAIQT